MSQVTFISVKAEHMQEFENYCKEFNTIIMDIENSKEDVIWVKIQVPPAMGDLYLLGLRMGGLMMAESIL